MFEKDIPHYHGFNNDPKHPYQGNTSAYIEQSHEYRRYPLCPGTIMTGLNVPSDETIADTTENKNRSQN
ncbi:MAG: hypothetical protein D3926_13370 [Desulfobacteraceae bacterium]|nr:MAG: hypothetical protein D3926_13370 [Desulfobacteraceae bacterium]